MKNSKVSGHLYGLIDRLQKCSEWKYPEREWTNDFYYGCAFEWMGKEDELEQRVIRFEKEMEASKTLKIK
jgi:hypothetical protein